MKSCPELAIRWRIDLNKVALALSLLLSGAILLAGCTTSTTIENPNFEEEENASSQTTESTVEEEPESSEEQNAEEVVEQPKQDDLGIAETFFWPSDDYDRWYFVAYIENPNTEYAWLSEPFDFEAFDSEGVLLDSDFEYGTILPNSTGVFYGYWFDIGNNMVSSMEVRGPTDGTLVGGDTGFIEVESIDYSNGRFSTDVSGVLVSNFESDQESVEVIVVIRDSSGSIITADRSYVDRLPAGGKARFEVSIFDFEVTDSMQIEAHPML